MGEPIDHLLYLKLIPAWIVSVSAPVSGVRDWGVTGDWSDADSRCDSCGTRRRSTNWVPPLLPLSQIED